MGTIPLENTVEGYLVKRIEKLGGWAFKGDTPGRRFIDRICVLPGGRTVFVECKRPKGGRREAHQIEWGKRLTALGHEFLFVNTKAQVDEYFPLDRA